MCNKFRLLNCFLFNIPIGLLASIGVKKCSSLTPRCKRLYAITTNVLKKYRRMNTNKALFKTRLREADKFANTYLIDKFSDKLSAAASLFTRLQIPESTKKSNGRRFTLEEKMLSLSLYKRSPKCYKLLSQMFTLSCKRTLNIILGSITIRPGISPLMMDVLKDNVKKLKASER